MTMRSLFDYGNAYYMNWVSNKVVTDIRNQLFSKIVRHSMDFFNRMRAGFLMSRISNDTRNMQAALTTVSSDIFKQPVTIVGAVTVLLLMDWKFTVVTLILFPICILPIRIFGRRARQAVQREQKGMGSVSVTMQESFSGIRVIKSFTRESTRRNHFGAAPSSSSRTRCAWSKRPKPPARSWKSSLQSASALPCFMFMQSNLSAGRFLWTDLRNFHSLRAGQKAQQDSYYHAALAWPRPTRSFRFLILFRACRTRRAR